MMSTSLNGLSSPRPNPPMARSASPVSGAACWRWDFPIASFHCANFPRRPGGRCFVAALVFAFSGEGGMLRTRKKWGDDEASPSRFDFFEFQNLKDGLRFAPRNMTTKDFL